jgi:hypothetical protein
MHIIKNFFEKLTMGVFSGARLPKWSDAKHPEPVKEDDNYDTKLAAYTRARARWALAVRQHLKCIFPVADSQLQGGHSVCVNRHICVPCVYHLFQCIVSLWMVILLYTLCK